MFGNKTAALLPEAEYIVYNAHMVYFLLKRKLNDLQFYYKINLVF
jgi:hypothetical protein